MSLEELFNLRAKLREINKDYSLEEISHHYDEAITHAIKLVNIYLIVLILLILITSFIIGAMGVEGIILIEMGTNGAYHILLKKDFGYFATYLGPYLTILLAVIARIIFKIYESFPGEIIKIKNKIFIVFIFLWPPSIIFFWHSFAVNLIKNDNISEYVFCFIAGWGFETFFKTMLKVLHRIEISVSKKIHKIAQQLFR